jgi:hypothetical protein
MVLSGITTVQEKKLEESESMKQCLAVCSEASRRMDCDGINDIEGFSMCVDSHQLIVSIMGNLISLKRVVAGNRSMQVRARCPRVSRDSHRVMSL